MSARPELRGAPKWRKHAQSELRGMKLAVSALPLAEALRNTIVSLDKAKNRIVILQDGRCLETNGIGVCGNGLRRLLGYLESAKSGRELVIDGKKLLAMPPEGFLDPIDMGDLTQGDTLARIGQIRFAVDRWRDEKAADIDSDSDLLGRCGIKHEFFEKIIKRVPSTSGVGTLNDKERKKASKKLKRTIREVLEMSGLLSSIHTMAMILSPDEIAALSELDARGQEEVGKYIAHSKALEKSGTIRGRAALLKAKYSIACPEALMALRAQWTAPETSWQAEAPEPLGGMNAQALKEPRRSEAEDIASVSVGFPNLFKRMMKPTADEQRLRRLKNIAKRLRRTGMGFEEIHERILVESGAQRANAASEESPKKVKRRHLAKTEPTQAERRRSARNETIDKDEFIASIRLSATAENAIRGHGLVPEDVVLCMFKGFNLGARSSAIGNAHYRGTIVRRNMLKALRMRYRELPGQPPHADDIIRFLKSVDLMRDFGSGASTKTKDDAMSLNTSPDTEIGRDMMRTITVALHRLRGAPA
ncbi:MAG: hypothetical protein AB1295_04145 [Candidatus Micrarchaeota archaeon]